MQVRAPLRDSVRLPTGRFCLEVYRHGSLIERLIEPNMVVIGAETVLARLLAGSGAGGVTQIGVGTSMVPASFGNTVLTGAFLKPVGNVSLPAPSQVSFGFTFGASEANGLSIGEFGLLDAAGVLFARKTRTFAPIPKDATVALSGTWTIDFGVSS